jgi:hypothetical protein
VPIEASTYLIWAGSRWRETGYDGSFVIDPGSLELKRMTLGTGELSPETSAREESKILDYPSGGTGVLLPNQAEARFVLRDATETESWTTLSDCRESTEKPPERPPELLIPLPADVPFKLELTARIDTSTAAAGDVVTARLAEPLRRPRFREVLMPAAAKFIGRVMRLEHHLDRGNLYFLIWLVFDAVEVNGVVSSFRARYDCKNCLIGYIGGQEWEHAFIFPTQAANIVVPAGFISTWLTGGGPPSK